MDGLLSNFERAYRCVDDKDARATLGRRRRVPVTYFFLYVINQQFQTLIIDLRIAYTNE
jgi:hypothetical protein